jgi:hypothetical protein
MFCVTVNREFETFSIIDKRNNKYKDTKTKIGNNDVTCIVILNTELNSSNDRYSAAMKLCS